MVKLTIATILFLNLNLFSKELRINISKHHGTNVRFSEYYTLECRFWFEGESHMDSAHCLLTDAKRKKSAAKATSNYMRPTYFRALKSVLALRVDSLLKGSDYPIDSLSIKKAGFTRIEISLNGRKRVFHNPGSTPTYDDQIAARIKDIILEMEEYLYRKVEIKLRRQLL